MTPQSNKTKNIFWIACATLLAFAALNAEALDLKGMIKNKTSTPSTPSTNPAYAETNADTAAYTDAKKHSDEVAKYIYNNFRGQAYPAVLSKISDYLGTSYYSTEEAVTTWYINKDAWRKYCVKVEVRPINDWQAKKWTVDTVFTQVPENEKCLSK